jgi:hypothetical protein
MSRIRSLHPGFASDEDLVTVSIPARLFFALLWTECDDQGLFEWKPTTLKMRLFPADNVDISGLLAELAAIDAVRSYEITGRQYGAVRNFRKHQRPKFPNATHPITDDIRKYVGLASAITETTDVEPPPVLPIAEIFPQMEDGEKEEKKEPDRAPIADEFERVFWPAYPIKDGKKDAKTAFLKARKSAPLAEIMAGLQRYSEKLALPNAPKPKYAQGWLNGERWNDGALPPVNANGNGHAPADAPPHRVLLWQGRLATWLESGTWDKGWSIHDCPTAVVNEYRDRLKLKPPPGTRVARETPDGEAA